MKIEEIRKVMQAINKDNELNFLPNELKRIVRSLKERRHDFIVGDFRFIHMDSIDYVGEPPPTFDYGKWFARDGIEHDLDEYYSFKVM